MDFDEETKVMQPCKH